MRPLRCSSSGAEVKVAVRVSGGSAGVIAGIAAKSVYCLVGVCNVQWSLTTPKRFPAVRGEARWALAIAPLQVLTLLLLFSAKCSLRFSKHRRLHRSAPFQIPPTQHTHQEKDLRTPHPPLVFALQGEDRSPRDNGRLAQHIRRLGRFDDESLRNPLGCPSWGNFLPSRSSGIAANPGSHVRNLRGRLARC